MNRRGFFAALAGAAAAAYDPERLLWIPGQKLISIPAPTALPQSRVLQGMAFGVGDMLTIGTEPRRWVVTAVYPHVILAPFFVLRGSERW